MSVPEPQESERIRREADSIERRVGFQMLGLGWQMTAEVIAGAALGWGADHLLGTAPKGVMVGSLVGVAVAIYSLVRGGLRLYKAVDRADAMRRKARQPAPGSAPETPGRRP